MEEELIGYVYEAVKSGLIERLGHHSYLVIEETANDMIYGSRLVTWSNNADLVRFTWDGKERSFLIEVTADLPLTAKSNWVRLSVTSFDPAYKNKEYLEEIITRVIQSLN
ncbi:hypothetical protein [Mucilaginibacter sp. HD30]